MDYLTATATATASTIVSHPDTDTGTRYRCKIMPRLFNHGEKITHTHPKLQTKWSGTYDANSNIILCSDDGQTYTSMSRFGRAHWRTERPEYVAGHSDGWDHSMIHRDGGWVSTKTLKRNLV